MPIRDVEIQDPSGLHARPATKFAEVARRFRSHVAVHKGGQRVDGKNVVDMLLLAASAGSVLRLDVQGEDAEDCLDALTALFREPLDEA